MVKQIIITKIFLKCQSNITLQLIANSKSDTFSTLIPSKKNSEVFWVLFRFLLGLLGVFGGGFGEVCFFVHLLLLCCYYYFIFVVFFFV